MPYEVKFKADSDKPNIGLITITHTDESDFSYSERGKLPDDEANLIAAAIAAKAAFDSNKTSASNYEQSILNKLNV